AAVRTLDHEENSAPVLPGERGQILEQRGDVGSILRHELLGNPRHGTRDGRVGTITPGDNYPSSLAGAAAAGFGRRALGWTDLGPRHPDHERDDRADHHDRRDHHPRLDPERKLPARRLLARRWHDRGPARIARIAR